MYSIVMEAESSKLDWMSISLHWNFEAQTCPSMAVLLCTTQEGLKTLQLHSKITVE